MGVYAADSTRDSYSIGNWTEKAIALRNGIITRNVIYAFVKTILWVKFISLSHSANTTAGIILPFRR